MYLFSECKCLLGNLHTGFHDGCASYTFMVSGGGVLFPYPLTEFLSTCVLHCTYSDWSEIESQSSFHLYFPNSYGYLSLKRNIHWPFVNFLLRIVSSLFRPFIDWQFCFFDVKSLLLFMYSRYQPLFKVYLAKIFCHVIGYLFYVSSVV